MLQQKFIVQVTTLPDCDDITRFDGTDEEKHSTDEEKHSTGEV
jgi:hypothetical protein